MKRNVMAAVTSVGLLLFAATVLAQDAPDAYHGDRNVRFHDEHWHGRLFEDVKKDVEHVQNVTWPGGKDNYRLSKTIAQLDQLQGKLAAHEYDQANLDEVIRTLSKVLKDNHMQERERDMLSEDLSRLQQYRDHHADWGR